MLKNTSSIFLLAASGALLCAPATAHNPGAILPNGAEFTSWEKALSFTKTYYVDNRNTGASDSNPGTEQRPFLTINKAAQVLRPGERVLIKTGVYRERVIPARGGSGPEKMISYEAAPGAKVVVKGSRLVKAGWKPSSGFSLRLPPGAPQPKIWSLDLEELQLNAYNPFGMVNMIEDRTATENIGAPPQGLKPFLLRRGMVFVDGQRLEQTELYREMAQKAGTFWSEYSGLVLHVRLPGDADPASHEVEVVVQEQVFAPKERHLSYIRVKGITFEHAANGFPIPQRGMVSANRGHHWIIEDCVMRQVNSVAVDIGNESWLADRPSTVGYAIVRRNLVTDAGICGLAGFGVMSTLVESNTFERIGWQEVEAMWESGAIKLHTVSDSLLRNNVIRHLRNAPGIWLDASNRNSRVTGNVIADVKSLRGGIYLEASHDANMIDHNIIWDIRGVMRPIRGAEPRLEGGWCVLNDGSDDAIIAHNLLGRCENAAVRTHTVEMRVVQGRGGTARGNRVANNVILQAGKSIDFSHEHNLSDGNLYGTSGYRGGRPGLNWIVIPENLRLDLAAWQKYFGFDKNGAQADVSAEVDPDELTLTWSVAGKVPSIATEKHFELDFEGRKTGEYRQPGPFLDIPRSASTIRIDPRKRGEDR
jgi:parallel beta-helix repeat protein